MLFFTLLTLLTARAHADDLPVVSTVASLARGADCSTGLITPDERTLARARDVMSWMTWTHPTITQLIKNVGNRDDQLAILAMPMGWTTMFRYDGRFDFSNTNKAYWAAVSFGVSKWHSDAMDEMRRRDNSIVHYREGASARSVLLRAILASLERLWIALEQVPIGDHWQAEFSLNDPLPDLTRHVRLKMSYKMNADDHQSIVELMTAVADPAVRATIEVIAAPELYAIRQLHHQLNSAVDGRLWGGGIRRALLRLIAEQRDSDLIQHLQTSVGARVLGDAEADLALTFQAEAGEPPEVDVSAVAQEFADLPSAVGPDTIAQLHVSLYRLANAINGVQAGLPGPATSRIEVPNDDDRLDELERLLKDRAGHFAFTVARLERAGVAYARMDEWLNAVARGLADPGPGTDPFALDRAAKLAADVAAVLAHARVAARDRLFLELERVAILGRVAVQLGQRHADRIEGASGEIEIATIREVIARMP